MSLRLRLLGKLGPLALVAAATLHAPAARADDVAIPFTTQLLANGMTVILHEDHSIPIVTVNLTYKVGSRFEAPHRTGFAHLFEHLMFMGTRRAPTKMFDAWMEAAGGWNNADTSEDRTEFYDVAPPTALPLLLWLEADRQRDLGPLMTQEKLDAQRDVVRNERRQTSENHAVRHRRAAPPGAALPRGAPVPPPRHRLARGPRGRDRRRRAGVLRRVVRPRQRLAGRRRRLRPRRRQGRHRAPLRRTPSHGAPVDPGVHPQRSRTATRRPR